jgi:hypothetical protein
LAIGQALAPLNKLSDCTGKAVVHAVPAVPNSWLDKWFGIPKEKKDPIATELDGADKAHKVVEFLSENKGPAKVVFGLNKAGLPAASEAAESVFTKIVPKLAPRAAQIKGLGYGLAAISITYETVSCYNKPGG